MNTPTFSRLHIPTGKRDHGIPFTRTHLNGADPSLCADVLMFRAVDSWNRQQSGIWHYWIG